MKLAHMIYDALTGDYHSLHEFARSRHYHALGVETTDINEHLPTLEMLTVQLNLKHVLELGVRDGDSTIALLSAVERIGGEVTSIDIEDCPVARKRVCNAYFDPLWTFIQDDDLMVEWDRPIDHLFIDTTHQYQHTVMELEKFAPFVAPGGLITLHDFAVPGVAKAVTKFLWKNPDMTLYSYMHNNGLAVIFKGDP